jgi:hypothetical protein
VKVKALETRLTYSFSAVWKMQHAVRLALTADIASEAGTSKRRVQQLVDLAFLTPDIVRDIANGTQPLGLTSDWCLRHELPAEWQAQRQRITTL